MSKKNYIILILIGFVIIMSVLMWFYFSPKTNTTNNEITPNTEYPFGTTGDSNTINIPTNNNDQTDNPFKISSSTEEVFVGSSSTSAKIKQIYKKPTSGLSFNNTNKGTDLDFIDRASGNIYKYKTYEQDNGVLRVTNTTIPKVQESIIFNKNQNIIFRSIDETSNEILSFLGKIGTTTDINIDEIKGSFLSKNILQLAINSSSTKIFELDQKDNNEGSFGYVYSVSSTTAKKQIFDSPISAWNISWPKEDIITFTTKPTYKDFGFLFFFNTKTFSFDRILGDMTGLTSNTNKEANLIAYSQTRGIPELDIYDVKNMEDKNIKIKTLSDKCVWSDKNPKILYCAVPNNIPSASYPDDWYQGLVSFNDSFWLINTEEGTTKEIFSNKNENNLNIDATEIKISPDDKYLSFINKNDLSLWLLEINNQ